MNKKDKRIKLCKKTKINNLEKFQKTFMGLNNERKAEKVNMCA